MDRYVDKHLRDCGLQTETGSAEKKKRFTIKMKTMKRLKVASSLLIADQVRPNHSAGERDGFRIFLDEFSKATLTLGKNPLHEGFRCVYQLKNNIF